MLYSRLLYLSLLYTLTINMGVYSTVPGATLNQSHDGSVKQMGYYESTSQAAFRLIDGMPSPFGIDYHYFGLMRIMRNNLMGILHGDKKNKGYEFEGTKYTLEQLVVFEHECKDQSRQQELMLCLSLIKQDFEVMVKPFLDCARRSPKGPLLHLMHASCELRNTPNSFILEWAVAEEGNELLFFHNELTTLDNVRSFFTDLSNFLDYMLSNCPKARKQFIDMAHKKSDTCNQQTKS